MIINLFNVVRFLLTFISSIYPIKTPVTKAEIELKENMQKLLNNIFHNGLEITEKIYFDYQESYNT